MLFNSLDYILFFLPVTGIIYYYLNKGRRLIWGKIFLILFSLIFYAWWKVEYLLLLVGSVGFNFYIGKLLINRPNRKILIFGVTVNLLLLIYYKYLHFISNQIEAITGFQFEIPEIILPLAISFFTFQQIAYLVDAYQGKIKDCKLSSYLLFVTFFPQLISGPIIHHTHLIPQFQNFKSISFEYVSSGITLFVIGLGKKVIVGDSFANISEALFNSANKLNDINTFDAWIGAMAYSFQIYFDFSGYSDMALGSALIFGICLPINFNSPYKQSSIITFWQTWHITLSTFLKNYLYIPLGGNKKGKLRKYMNLMATMLLGGLWHGASLQFVIWGVGHGFLLMINHWYRSKKNWGNNLKSKQKWLVSQCYWLVTFTSITILWVFFRAENFQTSLNIVFAMFSFEHTDITAIYNNSNQIVVILMFTMIAVKVLPNSQDIIGFDGSGIKKPIWVFNKKNAILISIYLCIIVLRLMVSGYEEFIYRFF